MSGLDDPPGDPAAGPSDPWAPRPVSPAEPGHPVPPLETPVVPMTHDPVAEDTWAPPADLASAADPAPAPGGDSAAGRAPLLTPPAAEGPIGGYGWPIPEAARPGNGDESYRSVPSAAGPPPPPPAPSRPERHSRNPVDRLTRGLPNGLRITIDWVVTIVGAIAIVLLVKAYIVNPYRIPSSSMEPTLHCSQPAVGCETKSVGPVDLSDRVLANRFLYKIRDPRRGEIIVFETPPSARLKCGAGGTFVKRLVGLPGDTVEVRLRKGDGYVFINGKPLKEPYIEQARRGAVGSFGPIKVKPANYFMMGDNRSQSCDSRLWGTVPRENLIGKVFATYWPPKRISLH